MTPKRVDLQQNPLPPDDGIPRSVGPMYPQTTESQAENRSIRSAVFVIHGMGQQIPFETLDQTASGLIRASTLLFQVPIAVQPEFGRTSDEISPALRQAFAAHQIELADRLTIELVKAGERWKISEMNGSALRSFIISKERGHLRIYNVPPEIHANTVQLGKQKLPRTEFALTTPAGKPMEVHVYEGYWAPITEGNVRLSDIINFLWDAGLNGIMNRGDDFSRFMFGGIQVFPLNSLPRLAVMAALLVFLSLLVTIVLFSIVAMIHLFQLPHVVEWPSVTLLNQLRLIVTIYIICVGAIGSPLWLVYQARVWLQNSRLQSIWRRLNSVLWWMFWICIGLTIIIGAFVCAFSIADFFQDVADDTQLTKLQIIWAWIAWGFLVMVSWQLRRVLIQSMGDVIAYVSSHKLDRFLDIRTKIKDWVQGRVAAIYDHQDEDGQLYYDQIGIIGHSLGSVIAYDAINAMLFQDAQEGHKLRVADRTKVLVTFGSPLDKTAYVFSRQGKHTTPTREALAASIQPLILDYQKYRQLKWINVYAARDLIGSALQYYDLPDNEGLHREQRIRNIEDKEALIPLLAHVEYWETSTMFQHFYQAFTDQL